MRQFSNTILIVIEVSAVLLGLNGLMATWGPAPAYPLFAWVPGSQGLWLARVCCAVVMLLPLVHLAAGMYIARVKRSVVIRTSGTVSLSLHQTAIVQYIRNSLDEIEEVLSHRVRVWPEGRNRIGVSIEVTMAPVEDVPGVQTIIEETIRDKVTGLLGAGRVKKIRVSVRNFGEKKRPEPPAQGEPGASEAATPGEASIPAARAETPASEDEKPAPSEPAGGEIKLAPPPAPSKGPVPVEPDAERAGSES